MKAWKIVSLALLLTVSACGKTVSPEAQIRARINAAGAAADKKEISTLREIVSDKYSDSQGQDKRVVEGVLRLYFIRNETLHVFTRTTSVEFPEKDKALAVVYVAATGQQIVNAQELSRVRADLYRFELSFVKEDKDWRVARAEWRPAELADFIH
jgi:hypothetical protein